MQWKVRFIALLPERHVLPLLPSSTTKGGRGRVYVLNSQKLGTCKNKYRIEFHLLSWNEVVGQLVTNTMPVFSLRFVNTTFVGFVQLNYLQIHVLI